MRRAKFHFKCGFIHYFFIFAVISSALFADPIGTNQAQKAVRGWLRQNSKPMAKAISNSPVEAQGLLDEDGQLLCYIINLIPEGFVILSADDQIEPVIAFSSTGYYNGDEKSPLTAMLRKDMAGRLAAVQQQNHDKGKAQDKALKWQSLLNANNSQAGQSPEIGIASITSVSDVWVDPFVQSLWDQGDVWDSGSMSYVPCYNYYTPENYPAGCVATAMAQVMRYHSYPTTGIGVHGFTIHVDGASETWYTRGGNGSGGAYTWSLMPYDPQSSVTLAERQMIGSLCYDAGVSIGMSYYSSGSSASLYYADQRLTDTFDYDNSVYTQSFTSAGDDRLWNLLNANLDAQMPVILGVHGDDGGHAVVADGYGYNQGTLYHHINMGWGGFDNAWYQLPTIDASYTFEVIDDAVYNVYTTGSGEIISGRVTNLAGAPLDGVTMRAYIGTSLQKQTFTNSRGVYALKNLASNTEYRISAEKSAETFLEQYVTTGNSLDLDTPGNRSGILFVSAEEGPPTAFGIETDVDSTDSVMIQLQVLDDGEPDPNLLRCIVTSLPAHGVLSEPNVGLIDIVPYTLAAGVSDVNYVPCPYFGGQDTFTYKANDGGTYPTGGDSNIATVTMNVNNKLFMNLDESTNTYSTLLMNAASYYDVRGQIIILQSEIGSAQRLTDLALDVYASPGGTLNNWTIRMQHTDWTSFNSVTSQFLTTGWETIYEADETITQTGWYTFHFNMPFEYNGTQNLLIDFSFNNNGLTEPTGGYFVQTGTGNDRFVGLASSTGTHGDPLEWTFWDLGGSYHIGSVPSMKLTGEVSIEPLTGDFDMTCDVKLPDIAIFSQAWQAASGDANYDAEYDLTAVKGVIDLQDLFILCEHWLDVYP